MFILKTLKISFVAACMLVSPLTFAKSVGTVTFKTGNPTITHADKTTSAAEKNTVLNAGDTIDTGNGRLQLSLIDGGKVSLQPNTVYKINKYEFSGKEDGSEYAFTELVKGGLRTVSGLIGHKNRDRYQLKTAVATIGIRGTEFTVNFYNNQLLMTTNHGSVDVCNQGGCLNALSGITIGVAGIGAAPKFSKTAAVAAVTPPATTKLAFAANDRITDTGTPLVIANSVAAMIPVTGPGNNPGTDPGNNPGAGDDDDDDIYDALFVLTQESNGLHDNGTLSGSVVLDTNNRITEILDDNSQVNYSFNNALGDVYQDQYVTLGLSSGVATNSLNVSTNLIDFQGIVGQFTDSSNLLNLASLTTPVTYNVLGSTGATAVTNTLGIISATTGSSNAVTGNLTVNFNTLAFGYNLNNIAVSNNTFSITGSGLSLTAGNSTFNATGTVTETSGALPNLLTCLLSCTGNLSGGNVVQGAFFGPNAERAGLQYSFTTTTIGNVTGSVVLGAPPIQ
ncbi:MAG: hypothetical protein CTY10_08395 [Methylotenera sp.]|nr:MAG: hypothetical protein CTY10_08395 [Methylotenera sp.]